MNSMTSPLFIALSRRLWRVRVEREAAWFSLDEARATRLTRRAEMLRNQILTLSIR